MENTYLHGLCMICQGKTPNTLQNIPVNIQWFFLYFFCRAYTSV